MGRTNAAPLGELLHKSNDWIKLDPHTEYQQITVRVYGRGIVARGVRKGIEIGASRLLRVRSGQFIISRIDARHGASGLIPAELDGGVVSGDFPVYDCDENRLRPGYLHWLSKTPAFVDACRAASEGSTNRVRLREARFDEIMLHLPAVSEQDIMVAQIDHIAAQLDDAQRLRNALNGDAKALLHSVFHRLIQGAAYRPLGEVAPIVRRRVEIELDGEYPELGVRGFGNGVFHKPTLLGADLDWQKLFRIEPGDLIVSNIKAWEGAIAVAAEQDQGRVASHRYITCVPRTDLATAEFLCFYLLTDEGNDQIQAASPGSADRNRTLAMNRLEQIRVPLPPIEKQQQFTALQAKAQAIRTAQAANQAELDALLPAVLDKVFKGRL
jgi:type I restriction enzyme, S subunit